MKDIKEMTYSQLIEYVKECNIKYRSGRPIVTDVEYDTILIPEVMSRNPDEEFLKEVEPDLIDGKTVKLPKLMLSTDKVYTIVELGQWLKRIKTACDVLKLSHKSVKYKLTPKLDGFAIYLTRTAAYSRGDGTYGTDLTRLLDRKVSVINQGLGPSELLIDPDYFERELSDYYSNTRNFQGSVTKSGDLSPLVITAIKEKAVVIYPFNELPHKTVEVTELLNRFDDLIREVKDLTSYDIDGVVIEVTDIRLKDYLGSTSQFHRWQIAFKDASEVKKTEVIEVTPQTSRTARVNPVAELSPIVVSNALISRVTVHHYGMVKALGIGPKAIVNITRAGLVIPKIVSVVKAVDPQIPRLCPSCGSELYWDIDFLYCSNKTTCKSQKVRTMEYFFDTIKIVDGFGYKTLEILYDAGILDVNMIYYLSYTDLREIGFGEQTSSNLILELERSKRYEIPDWTFLKAFGVKLMSGSNSEKLLAKYTLEEIFDLDIKKIQVIDGFGDITAKAYFDGLKSIKDDFWKLYNKGFNIVRSETLVISEDSPLLNKTVVFTGTLITGSRQDLSLHAKSLGAKVGTSVSSKTNILVTGENTGVNKLIAAKKHDVTLMNEDEYIKFISK